MKKVAIGNDHGGVEYKNEIIKRLGDRYDFINCGTDTLDSCDYPDFAFKVGELVRDNKASFGIVICKSGIGVSIAANKVKGVRCALVYFKENAALARKHNDANVLAFGVNNNSINEIIDMIIAYDSETFETRHQRRIDKITNYESKKV